MVSFPARAATRLILSLGIAVLTVAAPLIASTPAAFAQEALYPGAVGLVANTGGEPVLLREGASYDAAVVSSYYEGTPADIVEGPVYSEDGAAWYGVAIGGTFGYMSAGYLASGWEPAEAIQADSAPHVPAETLTAPADSPAATGGPVAVADLNLRASPHPDDIVLAVVPAGTPLTATGEWVDGYAGVVVDGQYGWVDGGWLGWNDSTRQEVPVQEVTLAQEAAPADVAPVAVVDGTAQAIDTANLYMGPSEADAVLHVIPAGAAVTITGEAANGWTPVLYDGVWGFAGSWLLTPSTAGPVELAQEAVPADGGATLTSDAGSGDLIATTLSDVNLRSGPDTVSPVLATIPAGMEVFPLAGPEAGFYQVEANGQVGWVSAEYLQVTADYLQKGKRKNKDQSGKVEGSEPADNAGSNSGGIIWPVSGGEWSIMQGYNGSSHQNQDSLWQYYYSLDLERNDGSTAGQTVYSPVNGVVRWTDPGSGGISIDMGDGYAVAMFHVTFDGSLQAGTPVSQGQALGTISGSGGPGFAGTPHLHFTLWTSDDNGNWDREAEPFVGKYAISGMAFPDIGGSQQYSGTTFYP